MSGLMCEFGSNLSRYVKTSYSQTSIDQGHYITTYNYQKKSSYY